MIRRGFQPALVAGWLLFGAASALGAAATGRYFYPNVSTDPPAAFKAGFPSDFEVGKLDARFKRRFGAYLVRIEEGSYALCDSCTWCGGSLNWDESRGLFVCS
ncbi:MAG: hypothetical protein L0216_08900 [Planctomycetales bacterium]|nr:hypothetical protein [Planctomycetales bacterium]